MHIIILNKGIFNFVEKFQIYARLWKLYDTK